MKKIWRSGLWLLSGLFVGLIANGAWAQPGGHTLQCTSAKNSGSKQKLVFHLKRSNGVGWYPPTFSLTIDGKQLAFNPTDDMKSYGDTIHDSPLGVIVVTAEDFEDEATTKGRFSITALPRTVRAYDHDGKRVTWSFQKAVDECSDANGTAKFQGFFRGFIESKSRTAKRGDDVSVDPQIMDCEIIYDSGTAC